MTIEHIAEMQRGMCYLIIIMAIIPAGCRNHLVNPPNGDGSWIFLGLQGKQVVKIKTSSSYIYACTGLDGLYRLPKSSQGSWEYVGLNDTSLIGGIDTTKGGHGPNTQGVMDVVINPQNDDQMLAAILVHKPNIPGIYETTNGGGIWFEADSGYGFDMPWWWPGHVVDSGIIKGAWTLFNPANQFDTIFAGHSEAGIVYRTTNSGLTWEQVLSFSLNTYSSVESFSQDPVRSNAIFAGGSTSGPMATTVEPAWFSMSTDGGVNWTMLMPPPEFFNLNAVVSICVTNSPHVIYLGMDGFVLGSWDEGKTWKEFVVGDNPPSFFTLVADPSDDRHVLAAAGPTFVESKDGGTSWVKLKVPEGFEGGIGLFTWDKESGNLYAVPGDNDGVYVLPKAASILFKN